MITSIRMVNFKNFVDETLRLGPFTMIVGSNASGKSNIRDAFRFLHGIGRGYSLAEIVKGKWGSGGQREWQPLRGAANEIVRLDPSSADAGSTFAFHVDMEVDGEPLYYSIEVEYDPHYVQYEIVEEKVRDRSRIIYGTKSSDGGSHWVDWYDGSLMEFEQGIPVLTQINRPQEWSDRIPPEVAKLRISDAFANMRFWEFSPELMRISAYPGTPLGDRGENLPAVLKDMCADPQLQSTLVSWLQELTPMDVSKLDFWQDPDTQVHLRLCERNGREVSAGSASDGTLRFLALLAVLLGKDPPKLCFFEEIDTGIHPVRLHLLTELIERQTTERNMQVVTTTHAPTMLTVIGDGTFANTSVVSRLEDTSDAVIRPVDGIPEASELRREQGLGRLHESGWLEDALFFTERNDDEDEA